MLEQHPRPLPEIVQHERRLHKDPAHPDILAGRSDPDPNTAPPHPSYKGRSHPAAKSHADASSAAGSHTRGLDASRTIGFWTTCRNPIAPSIKNHRNITGPKEPAHDLRPKTLENKQQQQDHHHDLHNQGVPRNNMLLQPFDHVQPLHRGGNCDGRGNNAVR